MKSEHLLLFLVLYLEEIEQFIISIMNLQNYKYIYNLSLYFNSKKITDHINANYFKTNFNKNSLKPTLNFNLKKNLKREFDVKEVIKNNGESINY